MNQAQLKQKKKQSAPDEDHSSLKGTLIFTMSLGVFLLASWFAIFYLFIARI